MKGYIDNYNFSELEVQKYWTFPASQRDNSKEHSKNMIFSGEYIGSRKYDGALYVFIKDEDGNMSLRGRSKNVSGEYLDKIGHVPHLHDYFNSLPNGTCLLGELVFPNNEGSRHTTTIMGCKEDKAIQRQEKGDKLFYYVFDILAYDNKSLIKATIEDRVELLRTLRATSSFVMIAEYFEGEKLWKYLGKVLSSGGEGIVITKKGTHYQPGKRPARQTLKIKKEVQETIDCFFTGNATAPTKEYTGKEIESWRYWENVKTGERVNKELYREYLDNPISWTPITKSYYNRWAGSLEIGVLKDGSVFPIGYLSGLSEDVKANFRNYKGKCIEVSAMEIEKDTYGLRHARLVNFRPDLAPSDCTWEKCFGKY